MIKLYLVNKNKIDMTKFLLKLEFKSNEEELSQELSFRVNKNIMNLDIELGSIVTLEDKDEIIRAIIVQKSIEDEAFVEYKAFDFGFYLNKSKETYQFKNEKISNAIAQIVKDAGIKIGNIANININVKKIYRNERLSDIIKDLIDIAFKESKQKYYMEIKNGKFYLYEEMSNVIESSFVMSSNLNKKNVFDFIIKKTQNLSIENMKNSIKVISNANNSKFEYEAKDNALIDKYGLLQDVKIIENKDIAKAKNIANNLLKDNKKIKNEYSLELMGNPHFRANRIIKLKDKEINGDYKIVNANHILEDGIYKMNINIRECIKL